MREDDGTGQQDDILVVDDKVTNLKILVALLEDAGYTVRAATSGKAALMICGKRPPILLLLDVMMPGMHGYEVCRHLQADEQTRDIPVIFISALNNPDDRVKGFRAGGVDFITKPFDASEVLARVKTHIRLQMLQRELQEKNRELERLATTDHLTGLYNRRYFLERLKECCSASSRYYTPCSLIMLDLDHFKRVNDRFGHDVGDQVLQTIARSMQKSLRDIDLSARWGGEEFVVLAPHTSLEEAVKLAERLRENFSARPIDPVGMVTASFGMICDNDCASPEKLIQRVDQALYAAKAAGRNCIRIHPSASGIIKGLQ